MLFLPGTIQVDMRVFGVLKYLSRGTLSYGYPVLLMLCVAETDLQNPTNALDVFWEPWSLVIWRDAGNDQLKEILEDE